MERAELVERLQAHLSRGAERGSINERQLVNLRQIVDEVVKVRGPVPSGATLGLGEVYSLYWDSGPHHLMVEVSDNSDEYDWFYINRDGLRDSREGWARFPDLDPIHQALSWFGSEVVGVG